MEPREATATIRRMLAELRAALHPSQREDPLLPGLAQRIEAFVSASGISDRLAAWIELHDWTREGTRTLRRGEDEGAQLDSSDTIRLRLMLHALEASTPVRERFRQAFEVLLVESDATSLIAETGMPSERGFLAEASERLWAKVLPEPRDPTDIGQFLRGCFRDDSHVARFARWSPELFQRLSTLIMPPETSAAATNLRTDFGDALRLLCLRVAAQGLSPKLRSRSHASTIEQSPFHRLCPAGEAMLAQWGEPEAEAAATWKSLLAACRAEMAEIHRQIGGEGVSVDIVFGLDVLDRALRRLETMGAIISTPAGPERTALVHQLLARLVRHAHEARSLRALANANLRLLHRRIIERSGETGEHYIARDRAEYRHLLLAACGGGLLTVGTASLKILISGAPGSDFLHGLMYGFNYAVSFMILHHCHLVLATKQPAMTAATLATIMRGHGGDERLDLIVDRIARITHSQLAAAAGNVFAVGAGALAVSNLWQLLSGHAFMEADAAAKLYDQLGPLTSGTVFYAALTGVILWASSLIGGWIDNWSAYHRLPQAFTDRGWTRWATLWRTNIAGWGTNISLGFMLGMTPAIGHFLGLPLDVRHVTLSTGMLFMACGSLGEAWWSGGWFLNALLGIAVMFVLNLGVSFALSLGTAIRAMEVPTGDQAELLRRLLARLLTRPGDFLLPPRTPMQGETV